MDMELLKKRVFVRSMVYRTVKTLVTEELSRNTWKDNAEIFSLYYSAV